ncbi:S41 family peptidase [Portibacter marinus]|uniref:S41 family peptidase n=1 Tax=Portibacter marinus TaxID=2898660 RepID=UPI001F36D167|nr:S41 family peptidase [Portibacter marinus]
MQHLRILIYFAAILIGHAGCKNTALSKPSLDEITNGITIDREFSTLSTLRSFNHIPIEDRIQLYYQLKAKASNPNYVKSENELNRYGYSLLWEDKPKEALEIFKLLVLEFPKGANGFDSLGEAYLALGHTSNAIRYYNKSLELNPYNYNAEDYLAKINDPSYKMDNPTHTFDAAFSAIDLKEDIDQLASMLIDLHPNLYLYQTEANFKTLIQEIKSNINNETNYATFRWYCQEIMASVNCSHTTMGDFYEENNMLPVERRFPLITRLVDGQLFVIDPLENEDQVNVKDQILKINGQPVEEIMDRIFDHLVSQAHSETPKIKKFNAYSTSLISYALGLPDKYNIDLKGEKETLALKPTEKHLMPQIDRSIPSCEESLCLEILNDPQTAILTISSFVYYKWMNFDEFKTFIDSSFKVIAENDIQNLIIDVRFNGGGAPEASIHLLRYLMDKPFEYYSRISGKNGKTIEDLSTKEVYQPFVHRFKGNQFYLMDGHGESTTGHFMSIVKQEALGTIFGEELGSNQLCTAGGVNVRLKNTRTMLNIADVTCVTYATELPLEIGIQPDVKVIQHIDQYFSKTDAVKEEALAFIRKI